MPTIEKIKIRTRHTVSAHVENAEPMVSTGFSPTGRRAEFIPSYVTATWDREDGAWVLAKVSASGMLIKADGTVSRITQAGWSGTIDERGHLYAGPDWVVDFLRDQRPPGFTAWFSDMTEEQRAEIIDRAARGALRRNEG